LSNADKGAVGLIPALELASLTIEQLRMIEQVGRTCDKYVQEFKKELAEAKKPPTTIGEWQERAVRLDRNQRQSRAEEKMLGRNAAHPGENAQPREGFGGGSYKEREGQITWRAGVSHTGEEYRGGGNTGGNQSGLWRDPNTMKVDRRSRGNRKCYYCGGFDHMARNCWEKRKARVVDVLQESTKENGGQ